MAANKYTDSNTTLTECKFIRTLGTHGSFMAREALLTNYIQAARKRDLWPGMNKLVVIDFAQAELAFEVGKRATRPELPCP